MTALDVRARGPLHSGLPLFSTGLPALDRALCGGLRASSLYVIAGPPGAGKTAVALQIAMHIAANHEVRYITGEIPDEQLYARIISAEVGRPWPDVNIYSQEAAIGRAVALMPLRFKVLWGRDVRAALESLTNKPPAILICDYMQVMARRGMSGDTRRDMADISDALTSFAVETGAVVLALSSTARVNYTSAKKGGMAVAKESGDVEFDASAIMYLSLSDDHRTASVAIEKHRYGPFPVEAELGFDGAHGRFIDGGTRPDNGVWNGNRRQVS